LWLVATPDCLTFPSWGFFLTHDLRAGPRAAYRGDPLLDRDQLLARHAMPVAAHPAPRLGGRTDQPVINGLDGVVATTGNSRSAPLISFTLTARKAMLGRAAGPPDNTAGVGVTSPFVSVPPVGLEPTLDGF